MHSTGSVIRFVLILTSVVALILALMSTVLSPIHKKNEAIYNKRSILKSIDSYLDKSVTQMSDDEVQGIFDEYIKQEVIDMNGQVLEANTILAKGYKSPEAEFIDMKKEKKKTDDDRMWPVFMFDNGKDKLNIISVRGNGLWDEIYAIIALKNDNNTIAGVSFDHVGETPGLGAEIKDNPGFSKSFIGKKVYSPEGEYKSIAVKKGGGKETYAVDGISGATVTCDGVSDMMYSGIKYYEPYFKKNK